MQPAEKPPPSFTHSKRTGVGGPGFPLPPSPSPSPLPPPNLTGEEVGNSGGRCCWSESPPSSTEGSLPRAHRAPEPLHGLAWGGDLSLLPLRLLHRRNSNTVFFLSGSLRDSGGGAPGSHVWEDFFSSRNLYGFKLLLWAEVQLCFQTNFCILAVVPCLLTELDPNFLFNRESSVSKCLQ